MTRDEIIALAKACGMCVRVTSDSFTIAADGDEVKSFYAAAYAAGIGAESDARKAAQQETTALREELTKRAMQAEKDAYQRGVRDEREACLKDVESIYSIDGLAASVIRSRNDQC